MGNAPPAVDVRQCCTHALEDCRRVGGAIFEEAGSSPTSTPYSPHRSLVDILREQEAEEGLRKAREPPNLAMITNIHAAPVRLHPAPRIAAEADEITPVNSGKPCYIGPEVTSGRVSDIEHVARAAVNTVALLCPPDQDKRKAMSQLRSARQALSEMAPFGLPIGSPKSCGRSRSVGSRILERPLTPSPLITCDEDELPVERQLTRPRSLSAEPSKHRTGTQTNSGFVVMSC